MQVAIDELATGLDIVDETQDKWMPMIVNEMISNIKPKATDTMAYFAVGEEDNA